MGNELIRALASEIAEQKKAIKLASRSIEDAKESIAEIEAKLARLAQGGTKRGKSEADEGDDGDDDDSLGL